MPTQTLHLYLSKDLLARTAEEMPGYDATHLSLRECAGFQDPLLTQIGLELWRELEQHSPTGVDAKYSELIGFGYQSRRAPYKTSFGMYFAMLNDPDGNTILLSGDLEENETTKEG